MSSSKKLSLVSAIFINLNVMIGTGIFINTYDLSAKAGAVGFLLYPIVGICMLPLINVIGKLLGHYPTGGLYAFGKSYSPFLGFLSCWSYFFGKLASCTLMISVATAMFQQLIPGAQTLNSMMVSLGILAFFTFLNLQNMKVGLLVQSFFLTSKSIPVLFTIVAGIFLFDTSTITINSFVFSNIIMHIPLVLYCLAGFETACSLSRNIENPSVNAPKAVYYSFGIIMILYGIFQGFIYMNTHAAIATMSSYKDIFPYISHQLFNSELIAHKMSVLLSFAIGSSALGGAYGILFSNSWNLYTLAEHKHTFISGTITQLNKHHTPWIAVVTESFICAMFLLSHQSSPLPLRQTAALGIVIAYTVSAFAYYQLLQKIGGTTKDFIISRAAFASCMIFVISCAISFFQTGLAPLFLFVSILIAGSMMFSLTNKKKLS